MLLDSILKRKIKKAIILGSGLDIRENRKAIERIHYKNIPQWPLGNVHGHKGCLDIYEDLLVLRGRCHIYEGFSWEEACFPSQFLIDHGIDNLILTNAAGGINQDFELGNLMQIKGYLNWLKPKKARANLSSLLEPIQYFETQNLPELDHQGVYIGVHGPNYETDAEINLFRNLGASAVGMSTIPEIETATKNKINLIAISVITNIYGKTEDLGHEGVVKVAKEASLRLSKILGLN